MANIKWSGIESRKYGLTARWYVSAYYGNDEDIDAAGLYDPSANITGHGGPTRPFATLSKYNQVAVNYEVCVVDSGWYDESLTTNRHKIVGDGNVIINGMIAADQTYVYNTTLIHFTSNNFGGLKDCKVIYGSYVSSYYYLEDSIFIETSFKSASNLPNRLNCHFIRCSGAIQFYGSDCRNNFFLGCEGLKMSLTMPRPAGYVNDYSIIIGTVQCSKSINGKLSGISLEDFKVDGNYFTRSYSEVDLWGNASGSGAAVDQIKQLFCNYFSPIYVDTWPEANLYLKTTAPDILKYGGLNGTYIGAKPVMHWFDSESLWDTYRDTGNTSDLEKDAVSKAIRISGAAESGTFRSLRISLPKPITADPAVFAANLVYNIEGTVQQGVSNQRIDTTPDMLPDNTANQRVVYDFKLATAPNNVDALSAFKNYELDREPTVDSQGRSHLDDNFDTTSEAKQVIQDFMIEFTLRKVVIA